MLRGEFKLLLLLKVPLRLLQCRRQLIYISEPLLFILLLHIFYFCVPYFVLEVLVLQRLAAILAITCRIITINCYLNVLEVSYTICTDLLAIGLAQVSIS